MFLNYYEKYKKNKVSNNLFTIKMNFIALWCKTKSTHFLQNSIANFSFLDIKNVYFSKMN